MSEVTAEQMPSFRQALVHFLGWDEHWDHGLTEADVNVESRWVEGSGCETCGFDSYLDTDVSIMCPCDGKGQKGRSDKRKGLWKNLDAEDVARFLSQA